VTEELRSEHGYIRTCGVNIHTIHVDEEHRLQGHGRLLVERAVGRGARRTRLGAGNTGARGFYEACGFHATEDDGFHVWYEVYV
jgi:GNAT superfamily N-acetyltransferase